MRGSKIVIRRTLDEVRKVVPSEAYTTPKVYVKHLPRRLRHTVVRAFSLDICSMYFDAFCSVNLALCRELQILIFVLFSLRCHWRLMTQLTKTCGIVSASALSKPDRSVVRKYGLRLNFTGAALETVVVVVEDFKSRMWVQQASRNET